MLLFSKYFIGWLFFSEKMSDDEIVATEENQAEGKKRFLWATDTSYGYTCVFLSLRNFVKFRFR